MQAVILAGGKGTRFGKLTEKTPKPLMLVAGRPAGLAGRQAGKAGKPILEYTLSSLPSQIDEAVIVIGHLGEQIKNKFGNNFGDIKIQYIDLKGKLLGTAYSVWQTKPLLENSKFLVLNGDDLYDKKELTTLIKHDLAIGLTKRIPPRPTYLNIELDKSQNVVSARYPTEKEMQTGILLATGAYVLNKNIFNYKMVKIGNGEYGLPQTMLAAAKQIPIKGVIMKNWLQINGPEDIKKAEKFLG